MSTRQESVSDATFKTWPFSCNFKFAGKNDQVTIVTCKYCPLVVSPIVTYCCKELHLIYGKIPRSVFENTKTSLVSCEDQSFCYYFKMLPH